MARIVYVTSGLVGILNSGLELACRLRSAGHDVTFVGARDVGGQVEHESFRFVRLEADELIKARLDDHVARVGRVRSLPTARRLRRELAANTEIDDLLAELAPDLLIVDVEVHTVVIAAHALGLPMVTRFDLLSVHRSWNQPPLHTAADAPTTALERLRCRGLWWKMLGARAVAMTLGELRPRRLRRRVSPYRYGTLSRPDLRCSAAARGLRLGTFTSWTHWLQPHVYTSVPMITTTMVEFEMPGPVPDDVFHVGPMLHRPTADTRADADARADWAAFRSRTERRGLPIVYCGLGTLNQRVADRVERVIAASSAGDWALVVGLGGQAEAARFRDLPDHVLVMGYAPQLDVLEVAAAAVVHGGINTINECICLGVPMVLSRTGKVDQPGNAARAEHHGIGVRVDLDGDPGPIADAVARVLADERIAANVAAMRARVDAYSGVLERVVDELLVSGSAGSSV